MSCEIHDDTWHCFLQEGEWVHIKKEEWNKSEMEPVEIKFPEGGPETGYPKGEFKPATPESYDGKKVNWNIIDESGLVREIKFNPFGKIWDILNGEG